MLELLAQGPIFLICLALLLGVVVIIHELGHYYVGRYFGAAVESFSVGFGAPIFEKKDKRGTRWRVNWIPLGGFVKFVGEGQMPGDVGKVETAPVGKRYNELGVGARSLVSLGGPFANFILAVVLFSVFFGFRGIEQYDVYAYDLAADSPAIEAGMQVGDVVQSVDGQRVRSYMDMTAITTMSSGRNVAFTVLRNGEPVELTIVPERVVRANPIGQVMPQGTIGMTPFFVQGSVEYKTFGPLGAVQKGSRETYKTLQRTVFMLSRIVTGKEPIALMSGPVAVGDAGRRIVNQTMAATEVPLADRWMALLWSAVQLCALVSVGIGFFNLLPLPVLDGGHLVFNAYEFVTGKTMPEKVQEMALMAGLGLLLTMFVFITWGDILETGLFNGPAG